MKPPECLVKPLQGASLPYDTKIELSPIYSLSYLYKFRDKIVLQMWCSNVVLIYACLSTVSKPFQYNSPRRNWLNNKGSFVLAIYVCKWGIVWIGLTWRTFVSLIYSPGVKSLCEKGVKNSGWFLPLQQVWNQTSHALKKALLQCLWR